MKPNFELITELQTLIRRDFPLAVNSALSPFDARPLVEGEWLYLDENYKLARGGTGHAVNAEVETQPNVFPVHTERGRYDTQAVQKANVLMLGMYEAETLVCSTANGLAVGSALQVQNVTHSSIRRRGLAVDDGATAGRVIVGYVSKISGSKVRFVHFGNLKK